MGFRTVIVKQRSKLDLKMNYLVCRGEKEIRVFIPEISTLILENTSISITTALISELTKNNVKIWLKLKNFSLIVIVGACSIFNDNEIYDLIKQLNYMQVYVLFVENFDKVNVKNIKKTIIDVDLCVI